MSQVRIGVDWAFKRLMFMRNSDWKGKERGWDGMGFDDGKLYSDSEF